MPENLLEQMNLLLLKMAAFLPGTHVNFLRRNLLKEVRTILDIGCGKGGSLFFIPAHKYLITGIDIYLPYLKYCVKEELYNNCILCDANYLPFKTKSFDVVLLLSVLEHLTKDEGIRLLRTTQDIARKQVILITPNGMTVQEEHHGNPFQKHRSGWTPDEFKRLGYKVKVYGFRFAKGLRAVNPVKAFVFLLLRAFIYFITALIVVIFPTLGGGIVAIKEFQTQ